MRQLSKFLKTNVTRRVQIGSLDFNRFEPLPDLSEETEDSADWLLTLTSAIKPPPLKKEAVTPEQLAFARAHDPEASKIAADYVAGKLEYLYTKVIETIKDFGGEEGLTIYEVHKNSGVEIQTISPRFAQLRRAGVIEENGMRRNHSGLMATIWRLVEPPTPDQTLVDSWVAHGQLRRRNSRYECGFCDSSWSQDTPSKVVAHYRAVHGMPN